MVILESLQTHKLEFFLGRLRRTFRAFEEEQPEAVTWAQVEGGKEQRFDGQHITNFFFCLAKESYLLLNVQKRKVGTDEAGRWDSGSTMLPTTCPSLLFTWVVLLGPEGDNLQQRARKKTSVFSSLSFDVFVDKNQLLNAIPHSNWYLGVFPIRFGTDLPNSTRTCPFYHDVFS